jgi:hypothetical protein
VEPFIRQKAGDSSGNEALPGRLQAQKYEDEPENVPEGKEEEYDRYDKQIRTLAHTCSASFQPRRRDELPAREHMVLAIGEYPQKWFQVI